MQMLVLLLFDSQSEGTSSIAGREASEEEAGEEIRVARTVNMVMIAIRVVCG
jgi:hypothetical protein